MNRKIKTGSGKLKIGDDWNAITIIALSQNNPLKAIAEFVENSIDAKATNITIIRGKERGIPYLRISDDGHGIADLEQVATNIGNSIKRKMKAAGDRELQGEFGIGLMSFWTVGEELYLTSATEGSNSFRMKLVKGNPDYSVTEVKSFVERRGTDLVIKPLLPGIKSLSGDRIQSYLASELRDRIAKSGVRIVIIDKTSRKELVVEPRRFNGRLLHNLPVVRSPYGEVYCELYLNEPSPDRELGLYKKGTRVVRKLSALDGFDSSPWNSPYIEGIIDCSFIQLTPGTRDGVIRDEAYENLLVSLQTVAEHLETLIREQKQAEEEIASKTILKRVAKAFREAFTFLADEQYAWMASGAPKRRSGGSEEGSAAGGKGTAETADGQALESDQPAQATDGVNIAQAILDGEAGPEAADDQRAFFDYPGPLHKLSIIPAKAVLPVKGQRKLRALCRDRKAKTIDSGLAIEWTIAEGLGSLESDGGTAVFTAGDEPAVSRIVCQATDGQNSLEAEAYITVTAELLGGEAVAGPGSGRGLPGYTYLRAAGELWRSRYDPAANLITINNGHSDFIFASKLRARLLRYIARLFAKELILFNFPGIDQGEALERMTEVLLYLDECL